MEDFEIGVAVPVTVTQEDADRCARDYGREPCIGHCILATILRNRVPVSIISMGAVTASVNNAETGDNTRYRFYLTDEEQRKTDMDLMWADEFDTEAAVALTEARSHIAHGEDAEMAIALTPEIREEAMKPVVQKFVGRQLLIKREY